MLDFILNWLAPTAHAAADPSVITATNSLATSVVDTAVGAITDFLPIIGGLLALVIGIYLVVRFVKRFAK